MIQTFVFVRYLGSFSSAPSPSFEVRPHSCCEAATIGSTSSKVHLLQTAAMPNARASHARQAVFVFLPSPRHF